MKEDWEYQGHPSYIYSYIVFHNEVDFIYMVLRYRELLTGVELEISRFTESH